ncbi:Caspase [Candidatus Magnetomoraceae bacterium gMMP-1]
MKKITTCIVFTVLLFFVAAVPVKSDGQIPIPDTGISKCYDNKREIPCPKQGQKFYGQDANYKINPMSFNKLDEYGNTLPDSAKSWAMVRDNVTGLIWEVKTNDGSVHDKDKKYSWHDAKNEFIADLNHDNFGGFSDWRLPTREELRSIVDYSIPYPGSTINTKYFPNTMSEFYWSSSSYASSNGYAWGVDFNGGNDYSNGKSSSYYVRAVRFGQDSVIRSFDNSIISNKRIIQLPPIISIESISFSEKALDAQETARLSVTVKNVGYSNARNVYAVFSCNVSEIYLPQKAEFPAISKDVGKQTITVNVKGSMDLPEGRAHIDVQIVEPEFNVKIQGKRLAFSTRKFRNPKLLLAKFAVVEDRSSSPNQRLDVNEMIELKIAVQNLGMGNAENVKISIENKQKGVTFIGMARGNEIRAEQKKIAPIGPGKYKSLSYLYFITTDFTDNALKFNISASEKYGRFGFSERKQVAVNTVLPEEGYIRPIAVDDDESETRVVIEDIPDFVVDIETNLPKTKMQNKDGIAVVIGNKNYQQTKKVDFAINDAITMKKYLVEVMGYKKGNVFFKKNAFKGDFETFFGTTGNYKGKLFNAVKQNISDVFVYYSGHGAPGQSDRRGYFVPVNADPQYVELAGYSADTFFKNLAKIRAKSFTIVLDCCFSGAELLKDVSPINIQVDVPVQSLKNAVILTSSKGTQFSSWYREKKHGMFTYFFLKAIHSKNADFNGDNKLTFGEIFHFVSDKSEGVPHFARRKNGVEQSPTIDGLHQKTLVVY